MERTAANFVFWAEADWYWPRFVALATLFYSPDWHRFLALLWLSRAAAVAVHCHAQTASRRCLAHQDGQCQAFGRPQRSKSTRDSLLSQRSFHQTGIASCALVAEVLLLSIGELSKQFERAHREGPLQPLICWQQGNDIGYLTRLCAVMSVL